MRLNPKELLFNYYCARSRLEPMLLPSKMDLHGDGDGFHQGMSSEGLTAEAPEKRQIDGEAVGAIKQ